VADTQPANHRDFSHPSIAWADPCRIKISAGHRARYHYSRSLVRLGRMVRPGSGSPGSGLMFEPLSLIRSRHLRLAIISSALLAALAPSPTSALSLLSFSGHKLARPNYELPGYQATRSGKAIFTTHLSCAASFRTPPRKARLELGLGLDPSRTLP